MIKSGHVIQLITESNQAVFCLACTSVRLIKVVSAGGFPVQVRITNLNSRSMWTSNWSANYSDVSR